MKKKSVIFGDEARDKLALGASKLAQAVVSTLGPRSKNVAINQDPQFPQVVHDGVTVAKSIKLQDPFEDMGCQIILEASVKTNELAGDGTTTATLLANSLIQEGTKLVKGTKLIKNGYNAMELREKLVKYADVIIRELELITIDVRSKKKARQVAKISAQNPIIGNLVAKALEEVGQDGVIMVERGGGFEDDVEIQKGMEFDNGYLSQHFVTDVHRMITVYEDGYVLLTDHTILGPDPIVPIIEKVQKTGKPLLIIANDVQGIALQTLVLSKIKLGLKCVAVAAPEFGERRKEMLDDLAVLTGGEVIASDTDMKLEDVEVGQLGRFRMIEVDSKNTRITPLNPDEDEIAERVSILRQNIAKEENPMLKARLEQRLARLSAGVAIIRVAGSSETEISERKERFVDAVHATKAAVSEGIVPGGGVALAQIALSKFNRVDQGEVETMIFEALIKPHKTILENGGINEDARPTNEELLKGKGMNVITKEIGNMIEMGIIDPARVTKSAVRNAFTVASILLTTDTLITDLEDENNKHE